jgi:5-formyltetrahydrofolate cyclo-ligase
MKGREREEEKKSRRRLEEENGKEEEENVACQKIMEVKRKRRIRKYDLDHPPPPNIPQYPPTHTPWSFQAQVGIHCCQPDNLFLGFITHKNPVKIYDAPQNNQPSIVIIFLQYNKVI